MPHQARLENDLRSFDVHAGRQLRALRERRGFTQAALARRMGLTLQQLQKYESAINRMTPALIARLADFLEVPPARFFEGPRMSEPSFHSSDSQLARWIDLFQSADDAKTRKKLLAMAEEMTNALEGEQRGNEPKDQADG